jgi:alpha-galactosidase
MKAMTDYIHALGLKAGIYTSPGPLTCAGYVGSYEHEAEDAARFTEWGFDFLKHDWCSYGKIAKDKSLQELQKPYRLMGNLLKQQKRDIVYNLCQYGMGDVSAWGADVGANCWRTAGDLGSQTELYDGLLADGFKLDGKEQWVRPGAYNDPDYLQVGPLYRGARGPRKLLPSPMTPDEQYTHMSLWCLLAAPLFIGGDVADLDEFTIALLSNDEVIEVDQDPLCQQAHRIATRGDTQIWAKEMEDGSRAVGLFNIGTSAADAQANWSELGLNGSHRVRDLWRQRELGQIENEFRTKVPAHGVVLVRIFAKE